MPKSDAAGTDIIGTSGVPVAITTTYTGVGVQVGSTDFLYYTTGIWYVYVTAKSTATRIDMRVQWAEDNVYFDAQGTEDITGGTVTVDSAEFQFDITGDAATFVKHLPLPCDGRRYAKFSVKSDAGTPSVYVRVVRGGYSANIVVPSPTATSLAWRSIQLSEATNTGDPSGILSAASQVANGWSVTITGLAVPCPAWDTAAWWTGPLLNPNGLQINSQMGFVFFRPRIVERTAPTGVDLYVACGMGTTADMAAAAAQGWGVRVAYEAAAARRCGITYCDAGAFTTTASIASFTTVRITEGSTASGYMSTPANSVYGGYASGLNAAEAPVGSGTSDWPFGASGVTQNVASTLWWWVAVGRIAGAGGTSPDTVVFDPVYYAVDPTGGT